MEWVDALRGKVVALDTAPLIYFIEGHPAYAAKPRAFFAAAERGELRIVTSLITLLEVLVHPLRDGREDLAREYRQILLNSNGISVLPLDPEIVEIAARLRALHNAKTPDAIQLATAKMGGASFLLTNDAGLPELPGISVLLVHNRKSSTPPSRLGLCCPQ